MVRIYELSKELGVTNNELITELAKLGISAKNHMSSIQDKDISKIKQNLRSTNTSEVVEKRVKSTIIRRRIKKIEPEAEPIQTSKAETELPEVDKASTEREEKEGLSLEKEKTSPVVAPEKAIEKEKKLAQTVEKVKAEQQREPSEPKGLAAKPEIESRPVEELVQKRYDEKSIKVKPTEGLRESKGETKKTKIEAKTEVAQKPIKKKVVFNKKEDRRTFYKKTGGDSKPLRGQTGKKAFLKKAEKKTQAVLPKEIKRKIKVLEAIPVNELAKKMGVKVGEVITKLLDLGMVATINQPLDIDTASIIASDFSYVIESTSIEEEFLGRTEDSPEELVARPPVVTVMGHVDHGKTSLLDAIRETDVMGKEAGGITQHIGAYHVSLPKGDIVFLDTPGHEAFTAMRARGAHVTDIVVLVVAADDGVMSQTSEAINHAKAAGVTLMVAINKIDKQNADIERVKGALMKYGLVPEELGGDTIIAEVSAKKKQGISELLELIILQAEVLELKANPNKPARGVVVEAKLDKGRGPVATVLVQEGTLKTGDPFIVGAKHGKIRAMIDEKGRKTTGVGPSLPIEIIGLSGVPEAGDNLVVLDDEKKTKQLSILREQKKREIELVRMKKITLEELYDKIQEEGVKELAIIIKADVQGSIEALHKALQELNTDSIKVNTLHSSVGGIVESDIMLASASNAIVIGFNVKSDLKVQQMAEREKVNIRFYNIIYDLISDVKKAMEGLLEPRLEEKVLGRAEVRDTFKISKIGTIAGSFVLDGKIVKGESIRLLRDNVVVYDGKMSSLKRFKDDVREVQSGYECGIGIESFNDLKVADIIESYTYEEVLQTL